MAGLDKEFTGEAWLAEGATVGYLPQEPQLDPTKDVLGNVMEGVAEKKAILDRYNELMMNYSDETADEATKLQDQIDSQNLWDLDSQVEHGDGRARAARPAMPTSTKLSGGEKRRVALCQLLLRAARPAAPRRADQPSRRRDGALARKASARVSRARC